ncbi:hypothetical protein HaLaN_16151 [Haematococcus lacustris]|uniref:Uncharacterized protein n=1 Tax=Haematococcus lacustris TaxID=44745 RepID=A0A699ZJT0_HAELA|nr:hypothetical protein HaLaN_16151 [Haematococcus lacustris]
MPHGAGWSQERGQPVRGLITPPPAKRSKPAAEPTKGKGKAAKAKPAPQPGRGSRQERGGSGWALEAGQGKQARAGRLRLGLGGRVGEAGKNGAAQAGPWRLCKVRGGLPHRASQLAAGGDGARLPGLRHRVSGAACPGQADPRGVWTHLPTPLPPCHLALPCCCGPQAAAEASCVSMLLWGAAEGPLPLCGQSLLLGFIASLSGQQLPGLARMSRLAVGAVRLTWRAVCVQIRPGDLEVVRRMKNGLTRLMKRVEMAVRACLVSNCHTSAGSMSSRAPGLLQLSRKPACPSHSTLPCPAQQQKASPCCQACTLRPGPSNASNTSTPSWAPRCHGMHPMARVLHPCLLCPACFLLHPAP